MSVSLLSHYISHCEKSKAKALLFSLVQENSDREYIRACSAVVIHKAIEKLNSEDNDFYFPTDETDHMIFRENQPLEYVIDCVCDSMKREKQNESRLYFNALEIIRNSFNDKRMCLAFVSGRLHIHPTRLSRIFKKYSGESFHDYVNKLIVKRSGEILLTTDKSIREISREMGYTTPEAFIRIFKRYKGVTPGSYRHL